MDALQLFYPIFDATREESMFMLGTLYSRNTPLHQTPASYSISVSE